MRSGSERMHTWTRTPSTGRNFQTLIMWITVSLKASCNGSISVNNYFFLDFFQFLLGFSKVPVFFVSPCTFENTWRKLVYVNVRYECVGGAIGRKHRAPHLSNHSFIVLLKHRVYVKYRTAQTTRTNSKQPSK